MASSSVTWRACAARWSTGSVQSQLVASLQAEGLMPPGRTGRVYVETGKIHLFDANTGVNLTRRPA